MTPFHCLVKAAGLSLPAAADLLGVRPDTAKSWSTGRRSAPSDVLADLAGLVRHQESAARRESTLDDPPPCPADDEQARALGFPSVDAWAVMRGRAIAMRGA